MEKQCKYCEQKFNDVSGRWFSNHVRWCDKNPKRNDTEAIKIANRKIHDTKLGELMSFEVTCQKCDLVFVVKEREKLFPQKTNYFCSRSCANSKLHSIETKDKIRQSLIVPLKTKVCLECNKTFEDKAWSKKRFCTVKCASQSRRSSNEFLAYRKDCKFKFNVWDFPEKFDLNLIYEHGWYKPKNRGDNLNGISRDHRVSVVYGWQNGIDSKIISHPANCKLMVHSENISKNKKCSLLLEELILQIEIWDKT